MKSEEKEGLRCCEAQSHLSRAKESSPGPENQQGDGGLVSSSVGRWVLHAAKVFASPHLGVSPRNQCQGKRI